jgi:hypothetical protein
MKAIGDRIWQIVVRMVTTIVERVKQMFRGKPKHAADGEGESKRQGKAFDDVRHQLKKVKGRKIKIGGIDKKAVNRPTVLRLLKRLQTKHGFSVLRLLTPPQEVQPIRVSGGFSPEKKIESDTFQDPDNEADRAAYTKDEMDGIKRRLEASYGAGTFVIDFEEGKNGSFTIQTKMDRLVLPKDLGKWAVDAEVWHLEDWRQFLKARSIPRGMVSQNIKKEYDEDSERIELRESEYCNSVAGSHGYGKEERGNLNNILNTRRERVRKIEEKESRQGPGVTHLLKMIGIYAPPAYVPLRSLAHASIEDLWLNGNANTIGVELKNSGRLSPASINELSEMLNRFSPTKSREEFAGLLAEAFGDDTRESP